MTEVSKIKLRNLTKTYKDITAVDDLTLDIEDGELFALLGVNGAGKSTTIKMLSTLTKPDSGDAFIDSKSVVTDSDYAKSVISVSPQESAVAENLTVKENLELMAYAHNMTKSKVDEKTAELLDKFSLEKYKDKRAKTLSGGYRRRLSIAMALINSPKVLCLDEPTLGLDVMSRADLWEIIRELKGKVTVILTTHYMEEAEKLSDRIGVMKDGKLIICDTAENLKSKTGKDNFEDAFIALVKEGVK